MVLSLLYALMTDIPVPSSGGLSGWYPLDDGDRKASPPQHISLPHPISSTSVPEKERRREVAVSVRLEKILHSLSEDDRRMRSLSLTGLSFLLPFGWLID
jgi:hypothetical protein